MRNFEELDPHFGPKKFPIRISLTKSTSNILTDSPPRPPQVENGVAVFKDPMLFYCRSNAEERSADNILAPSVDREIRRKGKKKKNSHTLHARAYIEISLVPLLSSTRWVLEYPADRGYEYAEVSYAILTRAPRFSMLSLSFSLCWFLVHFGSGSTMKLYMYAVIVRKNLTEKMILLILPCLCFSPLSLSLPLFFEEGCTGKSSMLKHDVGYGLRRLPL